MVRINRIVLGVLFGILLLGIVSSSFSFGDPRYNISSSYGPGNNVRGWLNMSFSNEPADSLFTTNTGDSISLLDLIKLNDLYYSCTPTDCNSSYTATSPSTTKNIDLLENETVIYGFKISGSDIPISSISDFSLEIDSNAPLSENPQIYVDLLNDNKDDFIPSYASSSYRAENYGCYNSADKLGEADITDQLEYCERVSIPPAPKVKAGAMLNKIGS